MPQLKIEAHFKSINSFVIKIDEKEFKFTFSRSSGAGGQNINKVNSKATLIWAIDDSISISSFVKERFKLKYKRFISDNLVIISSQKNRSQAQNIEDCKNKLHEYLSTVEFLPKKRRETKPTKGSVKKRLDSKKKKSLIKKMRRDNY